MFDEGIESAVAGRRGNGSIIYYLASPYCLYCALFVLSYFGLRLSPILVVLFSRVGVLKIL